MEQPEAARRQVPTELRDTDHASQAPNGEVEGPDDHAGQAPRAHTVFPRPQRVTTSRSRTPPTIVRRTRRKRSFLRVSKSAPPVADASMRTQQLIEFDLDCNHTFVSGEHRLRAVHAPRVRVIVFGD